MYIHIFHIPVLIQPLDAVIPVVVLPYDSEHLCSTELSCCNKNFRRLMERVYSLPCITQLYNE